jgi:hypothetical protein
MNEKKYEDYACEFKNEAECEEEFDEEMREKSKIREKGVDLE